MHTTAFWLLVSTLAIGSWSLENDVNEYAIELPVPPKGISAQDIYHANGAAPDKMTELDEPSFEQSADEESPANKSKEEYDYYDDCDLYYDDEQTTTTSSYQGECGPQPLYVDKRGASSPEDEDAEEHNYVIDVPSTSPSP